jgi:hypothetical protein
MPVEIHNIGGEYPYQIVTDEGVFGVMAELSKAREIAALLQDEINKKEKLDHVR